MVVVGVVCGSKSEVYTCVSVTAVEVIQDSVNVSGCGGWIQSYSWCQLS